ncbi:unnamed protein product [Mycena citricolor]|uniref:Uncharacterized protein n=1 Tax=Mycena citricolor TaxID=2018698 RepID=A0AAD2GY74_9AGAR|nr:unnamed protein product [Mycena citricolor]
MDKGVWNRIKHQLGVSKPSKQMLQMADRTLVKPTASWSGDVTIGKRRIAVDLEIFPSRGGWLFLFGKLSLAEAQAIHNYMRDKVTLPGQNGLATTVLRNDQAQRGEKKPDTPKLERFTGVLSAFSKDSSKQTEIQHTKGWMENDTQRRGWQEEMGNKEAIAVIQHMEARTSAHGDDIASTQGTFSDISSHDGIPEADSTSIHTRTTELFSPERVKAVLKLVTIGPVKC